MFVPHNFVIALIMMIASAVCWGSWANTYKGYEIIVLNFLLGLRAGNFLISSWYSRWAAQRTIHRVYQRSPTRQLGHLASTMFAGVIFNLANLLLAAAIDTRMGLAIRFFRWRLNRLVSSGVQLHSSAQRSRGLACDAGVVCALWR
jgi:glucose uptake protein